MKVFVCANLAKEKSAAAFPAIIAELQKNNIIPLAESKYADICQSLNISGITFADAEENAASCDVFLTIGGDGTILRWGKRAARHNKPLLGVNTGRLGFMATLETEDISKLSSLSSGSYEISPRMLIEVTLSAVGKTRHYTALNDVVLFKGVRSKLPEYIVYSGSTELTAVRADGLIISTPTGSTAYSLSAGGPIIDPRLSCFELTALSPHTLFSRPMLFSADTPLKAKYVAYENSSVFLSVDGSESIELSPDDHILIEKSDLTLKLIDIDGGSFYSSVHNKLIRPLK